MDSNQQCPTCGHRLPSKQNERLMKWVLRQLARNGALSQGELSRRVSSRDREALIPALEELRTRGVVVPVDRYRFAIAGTQAAIAAVPDPLRRRAQIRGRKSDPKDRVRGWMMGHLTRDGALSLTELSKRVASRDRATFFIVRDEALADGSLVRGDDGLVRIP